MTIAVGFLCDDGIVLGTDTQLTAPDSHKRYGCKLCRHESGQQNATWSAATAYAGYPDFFDSFNNYFRDEMQSAEKKWPVTPSLVRDVIAAILSRLPNETENKTELLCGVAFAEFPHKLYATKGAVVREVSGHTYIGYGDSSIIGYLVKMATHGGVHATQQAALICTYLIKAAKSYVDWCGGDTDIWTIAASGEIVTGSHVTAVEEHIGWLDFFTEQVFSGLFANVDEQEFEQRLSGMCARFRDERIELIRFFKPVKPPSPQ